ncbi:MAG: ABC transporter ATP-binding protein, partial [Enterococcus faecalis]|nr:ABC transporter ATP-binding protein [Enterococcus faecalis]
MTFVDLKDIRVSYDGKQDILKDLNISMEKGELVSLLGPSGCGKTTTLRVIAGLIKPNDGQFFVDQEELTKVPVHKRNFGMVFQSYALFPHLTIAENVAFGLKLRKESKQTMDQKVAEMLKVCGLESLGDRYPKQLSGGQRQRVALAR